ncbi:hypothetical protein BO78DRAFT_376793 [Aspergillus sclerotiicarbonarius CBS 121057]|uniref:Uncharacterized protein n=1 Tax=Aspergillus sclerotiicarbonarius (strain CBS 121057 / IBT 28362) TaxID=1448318 RepID=A0A319EFF3_ASPSB|nr:hypothetical protein BO78DRAFT_376793 [Aspergillus sclerotiicarbonarius CBS 121057]
MPPNTGKAIGDPSDDAYVAQVLAREARDSSLKYSAHGLEAYMPKRPTGAAPKPNTRFLRNIIRETDNHNAALKRKEEREARERMRQLKTQTSSSSSQDAKREQRRSQPLTGGGIGVVQCLQRGTNLTGADGDAKLRIPMMTGIYTQGRVVAIDRIPGLEADPQPIGMPILAVVADGIAVATILCRDPVPGPRQLLTGAGIKTVSAGATGALNSPSDNESDPLEDLVGPLPAKEDDGDYPAPIRSRGRGAYKPNMSNIDAHFAPDYDPTTDVHLEDDGQAGSRSTRRPVPGLMNGDDDWELALEALRDRARWKQRGEGRLREAGFSNDFVDRWKSNTTSTPGEDSEGRLEDVKWSKKGEGREWDRGKFVDEDGHIDVKASW